MPAAEKLFLEGLALFDEGRYGEALAKYRASNALASTPRVQANIIFCLVELRQDVEAIREYDFLGSHDEESMPPKSQAVLESYLLSLGRVLGFGMVSIDTPKPAAAFVDGKPWGKLPTRLPRRLPAGKHVLRLEIPGHSPDEREVLVRAGEMSLVRLVPRKLRPIDLSARMAIGPSLGTNLEALAATNSLALGFVLDARTSSPVGRAYSWNVGLGYLQAHSSANGVTWSLSNDTFTFQHSLALYGAFVHGGGAVRIELTKAVRLTLGLGAGGYFGAYRETGGGSSSSGDRADIDDGARFTFAPLVLPEIGLSKQIGSLRLGFDLAAMFVPFSTPMTAPKVDVKYCVMTNGIRVCDSNRWSLNSSVDARAMTTMLLFTPGIRLEMQF